MGRCDEYPARLGTRPFRSSQAIAEGLVTRAQLRGPRWRRLFPDVHIRVDAALDHLVRCQAALLFAPPETVIGFQAALGMYCPMTTLPPEAPVDLIVPRATSLRGHPGLRVHRMALRQKDMGLWCGLAVTSPARTGFDVARGKDFTRAVVAVDALLNRGLTTVPEVEQCALLGLPGSGRAREALKLALPGAESPMETRTRLLLVLAGLPVPDLQFEVRDDAFVARLDMAYPNYRLGIEYDGDHHRDLLIFQRDAVRANRLRLCGWNMLRFTADDVLRHPDRVVAQVRVALINQGWQPPVVQ